MLTVLDWSIRRATRIGPDVVLGVMTELPDIMGTMHGGMTTILKRAADRGDIPTADLPERVITLPSDLLRHELLLSRRPIAPSTAV